MNNDLEQISEERLKDMQKHVAAGMALGYADALLIRRVIDIALAAKQAKPIGEIRLSEYRSDGTREASVVCLHDQADWDNFTDGTLLYLNQQPAHTEQDGWIKCSERMPDDGESVLTSFRGGVRTAMCKVNNTFGNKMFVDEQTLFNGVPADYWMPLPAAPKPESEL